MIAAETANELVADGALAPEESKEYIRMIRQRAEIEEGESNKYGVMDDIKKEDMRKLIQTERQIELAFEEHRYWDVRRWKEGGFTSIGRMLITKNSDDSFTYTRSIKALVWDDKMYFYPIPDSEIRKNPNLKQNPGWDK